MRNFEGFTALLLLVLSCLPRIAGAQQVMLARAVISNAGSRASNGQTIGTLTVGQPGVGQASNGNQTLYYGFWNPFSATAGVPDHLPLSAGVDLQVWPNPASTETRLTLSIPSRSEVTITIYDADGRALRTWTSNSSAGVSTIPLDLHALTSGAYFAAVSIPGQIVQQRFDVIR